MHNLIQYNWTNTIDKRNPKLIESFLRSYEYDIKPNTSLI